MSDETKANYVNTYSCFLEKEGLTWKPPKYKRVHKLPFLPSETELDQLIAASGCKLGTFLQTLKETGADPRRSGWHHVADIDKEARTISINKPVKGHNPWMINVSAELIKRLDSLSKNERRIFNQRTLYSNFYYRRKVTARKLQNSRILHIKFTSFRHWKATMECHRTNWNVVHVSKILGHKNIQNTITYIDLEKAFYNRANTEEFTVKVAYNVGEACQLVEARFEYVTGCYSDGGKVFRKRK